MTSKLILTEVTTSVSRCRGSPSPASQRKIGRPPTIIALDEAHAALQPTPKRCHLLRNSGFHRARQPPARAFTGCGAGRLPGRPTTLGAARRARRGRVLGNADVPASCSTRACSARMKSRRRNSPRCAHGHCRSWRIGTSTRSAASFPDPRARGRRAEAPLLPRLAAGSHQDVLLPERDDALDPWLADADLLPSGHTHRQSDAADRPRAVPQPRQRRARVRPSSADRAARVDAVGEEWALVTVDEAQVSVEFRRVRYSLQELRRAVVASSHAADVSGRRVGLYRD